MREEDRLAAQHGAHDYRVKDAQNQRIIEEQRMQRDRDYSDQLARQQKQQQRERDEKQRRDSVSKKSRLKKPRERSKGKSDGDWLEWSTGFGIFGAISGAIAASTLSATPIPIEGVFASAAGAGVALGYLWKIIIACLIIGVIGFVVFKMFLN